MKVEEAFHFNEDEYQRTISDKSYSHTRLAKGIYRKRACISSSKTHIIISVLALPVTGGVSSVPMAISLRAISIASRKLLLLEAEWERRGQPALPKRAKHSFIPIVIAIGTSLITVGIEVGLAHGVGHDHLIRGSLDNLGVTDPNGYAISDVLPMGEAVHGALTTTVLHGVEEVGDHIAGGLVTSDAERAKHIPPENTSTSQDGPSETSY